MNTTDTDYPARALHIFAENALLDQHNNKHLEHLRTPLHRLKATDQYQPNVAKQDIDRVLARGRSETGGLNSEILVKENCTVMLTTNIDINGQMDVIEKIAVNQNTSKPSVIYIEFDDSQAGITAIEKWADKYARENAVVPIQPVLTRIKVRPGKSSSPEIQRMQFPITLACACTVHKVQGLTVNEIVLCFDLHRQNHFNYGQIYVALTRTNLCKDCMLLDNYWKTNTLEPIQKYMQNTTDYDNKLTLHLVLNYKSCSKPSSMSLEYTFPKKTVLTSSMIKVSQSVIS